MLFSFSFIFSGEIEEIIGIVYPKNTGLLGIVQFEVLKKTTKTKTRKIIVFSLKNRNGKRQPILPEQIILLNKINRNILKFDKIGFVVNEQTITFCSMYELSKLDRLNVIEFCR